MASKTQTAAKPETLRKVARRLVLCLDGTWNTDDAQTVTNIVEIRDRILPLGADEVPQKIYYDWGVGTGLGFDRIFGGAFGSGMGDKILGACRFLSDNFIQDDGHTTEIYIFGFSRGAYTARAVAGFLGSAGLLRPEHWNAANEQAVWRYYRTPPKKRMPADRVAFKKLLFDDVRVQCLGIFDTVGARGVPVRWFYKLNRLRYEFHDTELGANVDVALHALGIDEKRWAFQPAVWSKPPHVPNKLVEQVWFPGVHSNVGGGYDDDRLSKIVLDWMMSRVRASGLGLAFDHPYLDKAPEEFAEGEIYESRSLPMFWTDYPVPAFRKIANIAPNTRGYRPVGLVPHGVVLNEYLHWTCLHRWRKYHDAPRKQRYAPANLELAVERVKRTYFPADAAADRGPLLLVVGKFGDILRPDNESDIEQVYDWLMGAETDA